MRIYYTLHGAHYHMRVFMNGGKLGDLCCRESEWGAFTRSFNHMHVSFYNEHDFIDGWAPQGEIDDEQI